MRKIKVLNLYAGIGGNRKYWSNVEVTSVEINKEIAFVYKKFFPEDTVVVADAHRFLEENYMRYDFIWSSPPCPSHSQYRYNVGVKAKGFNPVFPDMRLYEEIIFLKYYFSGMWVVENTVSYYKPLIQPQKISRHFFWANFFIRPVKIEASKIRSKNKICELEDFLKIDLSRFKLKNKRQILRNCVNPVLGKHVLDCAFPDKNAKGRKDE